MAKDQKAPKQLSEKEKQKKAEAKARMEAYLKKRADKLAKLKAEDPVGYVRALNFKEFKESSLITTGDGAPAAWLQFCDAKSKAEVDFWNTQKTARVANQKVVEKKKLKRAKLMELVAKIDAELEGGE